MIHTYTRAFEYRAAVAVDAERTYTLTATGPDGDDAEGVRHAFRFDDESQADLRRLAENALASVDNVSVESVAVEPGYLTATVRASDGREFKSGAAPAAVLDALNSVAPTYNDANADMTAGRDAYLNGIHFRDSFIETVRPDDGSAPTAEEWLAEHVDPGAYPPTTPDVDGDAPLFVVESDGRDRDTPEPDGPYLPLVGIAPVSPASYEAESVGGRDVNESIVFEWADPDREQFVEYLENGRWNWSPTPFRVAVYPTHIRVELQSQSRRSLPAVSVFDPLDGIVAKFNQRRRDIQVGQLPRPRRRPNLEMAEHRYVGVTDPDGRVVEWLAARGAHTVDGEPVEPEPEPAPDGGEADTDDGDGGLKGRVDTVFEKAAKQGIRRSVRRETRPGREG